MSEETFDKGAGALLMAIERLPRILRAHEALRSYEGRVGKLMHWTIDFPEGVAHNRCGLRHLGKHFYCLEACHGTLDGAPMVDLHLRFADGWTAWVWERDVAWAETAGSSPDDPKAS